MGKADSLDARLEALESLQAPALRLEWEKVYGTPAPRRIGRDLLLRAVAYPFTRPLSIESAGGFILSRASSCSSVTGT